MKVWVVKKDGGHYDVATLGECPPCDRDGFFCSQRTPCFEVPHFPGDALFPSLEVGVPRQFDVTTEEVRQ